MTAWKSLERQVARKLAARRNPNNGRPQADVESPDLVAECKYRKALPGWLKEALAQARSQAKGRLPIVVLKERYSREAIVLMALSDFEKRFSRQ